MKSLDYSCPFTCGWSDDRNKRCTLSDGNGRIMYLVYVQSAAAAALCCDDTAAAVVTAACCSFSSSYTRHIGLFFIPIAILFYSERKWFI